MQQTNSYQAVLVKSKLTSYAIFTYQCGDIQWSNLNGDGASAVVGYNAAGEKFFNHEASGYAFIGDSISCSSMLKSHLEKRQADPSGNTVTMPLGSCQDLEDLYDHSRCLYYSCTDELDFNDQTFDPTDIVKQFTPCPTTSSNAKEEIEFKYQDQFPQETECYTKEYFDFSFRGELSGHTFHIYQQCCYNKETCVKYGQVIKFCVYLCMHVYIITKLTWCLILFSTRIHRLHIIHLKTYYTEICRKTLLKRKSSHITLHALCACIIFFH